MAGWAEHSPIRSCSTRPVSSYPTRSSSDRRQCTGSCGSGWWRSGTTSTAWRAEVAPVVGLATTLLRPAVDVAGRLTLGAVDLALAWPVTEQALGRVLDSPLMERVPRRLADRLLAAGIADDI